MGVIINRAALNCCVILRRGEERDNAKDVIEHGREREETWLVRRGGRAGGGDDTKYWQCIR